MRTKSLLWCPLWINYGSSIAVYSDETGIVLAFLVLLGLNMLFAFIAASLVACEVNIDVLYNNCY